MSDLLDFLMSKLVPPDSQLVNTSGNLQNGYEEESSPVLDLDANQNCLVYNDTNLRSSMKPDRVHKIQDWSALLLLYRDHLVSCESPITAANDAQSYIWPSIWKGRDALVIGPPKTGKTVSHLIPLIGTGLMFKASKLENSFSFSVIICPTAESVGKVFSLARKLVPPNSLKIVSVERSSVLNQRKPDIKSELRNATDIVIATPEAFHQIIEHSILSLKNCSRLVLEEADKLFVLHLHIVKQIYLKYIMAGKEKIQSVPSLKKDASVVLKMCKTIVIAEKFTNEVAEFQFVSHHNPITVITDYFEAAIRAKVEFNAYFAINEKKRQEHLRDAAIKALEYLDRVVICCSDEIETQEIIDVLEPYLEWESVGPLKKEKCLEFVWKDMTNYDLNQLRSKWNSNNPPVLVISDDQIESMELFAQIKNAECIIHYSVPSDVNTKGQFSRRFILMSSKFPKDPSRQQINCLLSALILTEKNKNQAHEFTELYERLNLQVPEALINLRNAAPRGLCRTMASFGVCPFQKYFCYKDHFLLKMPDDPLPQSGQVKLFIGSVVTANEFYVRILETRDNATRGEWKVYPHQLSEFADDLNLLRNMKHDRVLDVRPGELYGILFKEDVRRVRILSDQQKAQLEFYEYEHRKYVDVQHIDYGTRTKVELRSLIPLPEHLKNPPALAHRIFVTGIKPPENLVTWSPESFDFVRLLFEKEEFHHLSGWICITASGCMWLQDVRIHNVLKSIQHGIETVGQSIAHLLKENGHAVAAPEPPFPGHNENVSVLKAQLRVDQQWSIAMKAFLPNDEIVDVNLIHFNGISEFFLRRTAFSKCLENLEDEMLEDDDLKPIREPLVGMICLQKYSHKQETSLNRVSILRIKKNNCVDVFYLDHGEDLEVDLDTLFEIRSKFITQLPFQAIKCSWHGLTSESEIDPEIVYDLTRLEDNTFKNLLVRRIGDLIDGSYEVSLYRFDHETEDTWVYLNLAGSLPNVKLIPSDEDPVLKINKPLKVISNEKIELDDEDGLSDSTDPLCEETKNFIYDVNNMVGEITRKTAQMYLPAEIGFIAQGNGREVEDALEEIPEFQNPFLERPVVDYRPEDFDYEVNPDLPPNPIDMDDVEDNESDDDLDLDRSANDDLDMMVGEGFDVEVNQDGEPILHISGNEEPELQDFPGA